ncbi:MAG: ABC transporter substrate-binding protein [Clostridia bacterium]|nr:ABC transporter substrate-binding protein [Clostridia bacterium]
MKRIVCLTLTLLLLLSACAPQKTQSTPAVETGAVVALSRSVAELWLLSGGTLAGITEDATDLDAAGAVTIGTLTTPSLEAILALSPDLVLLTEDLAAHREIKESLTGMGITVQSIDINSFDDYDSTMQTLTALTGREDLYAQNVTAVRQQINAVVKDAPYTNRPKNEKPTYLAVRVSATKNKALKNDYFACDIFNDLGLINIAADNDTFDELNLEAIAFAQPDYIFVVLQGDEDKALDSYRKALESHDVWGALEAVKNGRVHILPKDLFQYKPNAKWGDAYSYASDVINGENQ